MTMEDRAIQFHNDGLKAKFASLFEIASKKYDIRSFFFVIIDTPLFTDCFLSEDVYSQSPKYILELFEEQCKNKPLSRVLFEEDIAYWVGYLSASFYLDSGFDIRTINKEQFDWLYDNYDILHTQSVKYVYQEFTEEILKRANSLN